MELWVRSQSKKNLMKAEDIVANENYIEVFKQNDESTRVATYKTKERALEVLDEIQNKIKQQFIVKSSALMSLEDIDKEENRLIWKYDKEFIMQDSGFEIVPINDGIIVYEMPEE